MLSPSRTWWAFALCVAPALPAAAQSLPIPTPAVRNQQAADDSPHEPDRRPGQTQTQPTLQLGALNLSDTGASWRSQSEVDRLHLRLTHGSGQGLNAGIDYGRLLSDQWAVGLNASAGPGHLDLVLNGLYSPAPQWHIGLSAGALRRISSYQFVSGAADVAVRQHSARLSVQHDLGQDNLLQGIGGALYLAQARRPDDQPLVMREETDTLLRFLVDPRAIAPGRLQGFNASMILKPWADGRLKLSLGQETLRFRYQDGTGTRERRVSSSVEWRQHLPGCWQFDAGLSTGVAGDRLQLGLRHGVWVVGVARQAGRDGLASDTRVTVAMEIPLDGPTTPRCGGAPADATQQRALDRLDAVFQRPRELPTTVLAKVDPTARPYLIAQFDKAGLGGATVDATPDALWIRLTAMPLAIADVFLNGQPYAGTPFISIQDGALRIALATLPNPGPGASNQIETIVVLPGGLLALVGFTVNGF